jgi:hypothetical protein
MVVRSKCTAAGYNDHPISSDDNGMARGTSAVGLSPTATHGALRQLLPTPSPSGHQENIELAGIMQTQPLQDWVSNTGMYSIIMAKFTRGEKPDTPMRFVDYNPHQHEIASHPVGVDIVAWALDHGYRPSGRKGGLVNAMIWASRKGYFGGEPHHPLLVAQAARYIAACSACND